MGNYPYITFTPGAYFYRVTLSQTSTGNPTATLGENTLSGTPTWLRTAEGTYTCTLAGAFTLNKTILSKPNCHMGEVGGEFIAELRRTDADTITLYVRDPGGNLVDGFTAMDIAIEVLV